jgi:cytochrome c556
MSVGFGRTAAMALGVAVVLSAGAALAQDSGASQSPAAQAVAARHQNFKQLGRAFKAILDELKAPAPDKAVLSANATKMNALASQEATWFPKGSGRESGVKTGAKPEIWSDPAGFAAAVQRLQGETAKLQQIAAGGDLEAFKAQGRAAGGACKNCHDKYRFPDRD